MLDWPVAGAKSRSGRRGMVSAVVELSRTTSEGGGTVETAVKAETGVVGVITVVDVGRRSRSLLPQGLEVELLQLLLLLLLLLLEPLFGCGQFAGHRSELARMVMVVQNLARDAFRRDA